MNSKELFSMALNLQSPWYITDVKLDVPKGETFGRVDIYIDFTKGHKFTTSSGAMKTAHDTVERTWRHLNFFQHECFLHARVPRLRDEKKTETVQVPWARSGSGFTMMFEALTMLMIESEMPVKRVAKLLREWPNRIWRIFSYWLEKAVAADEQDSVFNIGIDETSTRKGHNYVTVAVDMDERRVIYATKGKDSKCLDKLKKHLEDKECPAGQIENISIDMSPAFISGALKNFPNASITFDKFHVTKIINEAMDQVRKAESKEINDLKGQKYIFLRNEQDLTLEQKEAKFHLVMGYPKLAEAFRLKLLFSDFWNMSLDQAEPYLWYWCDIAVESKIAPFIKAAGTIKAHWSGIINHIKTKLNNGILEGINTKIQLAKKRARGYRNIKNFINMIYFIAGKLKFDYPLYMA